MKKNTLHLKLANSLYTLSARQGKSAQFFDQLGQLSALMSDPRLLEVLNKMAGLKQPQILDALQASLPKEIFPELINLLTLLVRNQKAALLPLIQGAFQKYYFTTEGIADFRIVSSRELSDQEKKQIAEKLGHSGESHLSYSIDADLIAGVQIYKNGQMTDYSVKNQLEFLRRSLLGETIV